MGRGYARYAGRRPMMTYTTTSMGSVVGDTERSNDSVVNVQVTDEQLNILDRALRVYSNILASTPKRDCGSVLRDALPFTTPAVVWSERRGVECLRSVVDAAKQQAHLIHDPLEDLQPYGR